MKSLLFSFFLILIVTSSHAQSDTIRYFSLSDTVFTEGSIYYFDAWFQHTRHYDYWTGDALPHIVDFLKRHPNIHVQVGFHTDIRPIPMTNDTLSYRRAVSLIDHFVKEGSHPERLVPFGYGEKKPRVLEKDTVVVYNRKEFHFQQGAFLDREFIESLPYHDYREAAHQLNRRAELKIIRIE